MFANKRIAREAARRLINAQRPDFTLEDWKGLESWLSADARHEAAYRSEAQILVVALGMDSARLTSARRSRKSVRIATWLLSGIGTALVVYLALVFVGVPWKGMFGPTPVEYATRIGQQLNVALLDGSQVFLNTNTKLRVREARDRVLIDLLNGEVSLNVVHNARRSFIVSVSGASISDVGTNFTVRKLGGSHVSVFVSEGKVRVNCVEDRPARRESRECGADLEAGDAASVDPGSVQLEHVDSAQMRRRLLWTRGILEFEDSSLGEIVEEINRYRKRPLRIADPSIDGVRWLMVIPVANVDNFESFGKFFHFRAEESTTVPGVIDLVSAP